MKKSRIILSIFSIVSLIICVIIAIILKYNNSNVFNNKNLNTSNYNSSSINTNNNDSNYNIINIDNSDKITNNSNKINHHDTTITNSVSTNSVNTNSENESDKTEIANAYFDNITMSNVNSDNLYKATNNLLKNLYENINNSDITQINSIVENNISNNFDKDDQDMISNQAYRIYKNINTPANIPFNGLSRKFCELISIDEIESNCQYCTYKANVKYIFTQMPLALGDTQYSYEKIVTEYIKLNSDGKISSIVDIQ